MNYKSYARLSKEAMRILLTTFSTMAEENIHFSVNCDNCKHSKNNSSTIKFSPSFNIEASSSNESDEVNECCKNCFDNEVITTSYTHYLKGKAGKRDVAIISKKLNNYRISKSCIKQYLYYYFIPQDGTNIRRKVKYKDIADFCSISVNQVKNNIKTLRDMGLSYATPVGRGVVDIFIVHEPHQHEKGGKGYATIKLSFLNKILNITSVNVLRSTLITMLKVDFIKNSLVGKNNKYNTNSLKEYLPSYISDSPKLFNRCLNNEENLFIYKNGNIYINPIKIKLKHNSNMTPVNTTHKVIRRVHNTDVISMRSKLVNESIHENRGTTLKKTKRKLRKKIKDYVNSVGGSFSKRYSELLIELDSVKKLGYKYGKYAEKLENGILIEENKALKGLTECAVKFGFENVRRALDYIFEKHCHVEDNLINGFKNKESIKKNEIISPELFVSTILHNNMKINGSLHMFNF